MVQIIFLYGYQLERYLKKIHWHFVQEVTNQKNLCTSVNFNDVSELSNDPNLTVFDENALEEESKNGILIFKVSAGDAIFFHNRTLHRSLLVHQIQLDQLYP